MNILKTSHNSGVFYFHFYLLNMEDKQTWEKYINKPITKLLNSSLIMSIYPMIDHIDAYEIEDINRLILRIYVNDSEMTKDNMYQRELDPHYLVDYHLMKYLPYFNFPRNFRVGFVVVGTDGSIINSSVD